MKSPSRPKEDPEVKAQRQREKRIAAGERRVAAQRNAASMTTDYNSVYGQRSLFGGGMDEAPPPAEAPAEGPTDWWSDRGWTEKQVKRALQPARRYRGDSDWEEMRYRRRMKEREKIRSVALMRATFGNK